MRTDMFKLLIGFIALTFTSLFLGSVLPVEVFLSPWIVLIVLVVKFFFLFYLGFRDYQEN
jgi:hypothetical protein